MCVSVKSHRIQCQECVHGLPYIDDECCWSAVESSSAKCRVPEKQIEFKL